ncbi:hypothetical protein HDU76_010088, partial [Blyttiomyces sp. JEL0837]
MMSGGRMQSSGDVIADHHDYPYQQQSQYSPQSQNMDHQQLHHQYHGYQSQQQPIYQKSDERIKAERFVDSLEELLPATCGQVGLRKVRENMTLKVLLTELSEFAELFVQTLFEGGCDSDPTSSQIKQHFQYAFDDANHDNSTPNQTTLKQMDNKVGAESATGSYHNDFARASSSSSSSSTVTSPPPLHPSTSPSTLDPYTSTSASTLPSPITASSTSDSSTTSAKSTFDKCILQPIVHMKVPSLQGYIHRLMKRTQLSTSTLALAMLLLLRVREGIVKHVKQVYGDKKRRVAAAVTERENALRLPHGMNMDLGLPHRNFQGSTIGGQPISPLEMQMQMPFATSSYSGKSLSGLGSVSSGSGPGQSCNYQNGGFGSHYMGNETGTGSPVSGGEEEPLNVMCFPINLI